jgi:drug/metabolite transporter (DMT)-like permease
MKRGRAELALAMVTAIWGSTFVVVKAALDQIAPLPFLALRFVIAALALALIWRGALKTKAAWVPGLCAGCLLFGAYVFQTVGLETTTPSKSAFLTGMSIPMVPLVGSIVYRSKPRLIEVFGILVASGGMALMTWPSGRLALAQGDLFSLLCALVFALHIVFIGHYTRLLGFRPLALVQVATAALLACAVTGFTRPRNVHVTPQVMAAVLVTGLLATALAFSVMAWAQQYTSATRAALIFSLEPVVAWFTSWLLNGEVLNGRAETGAALILAGVLLVELKRPASLGHPLRESVGRSTRDV